jgi:hypothetical protein
MKTISMPRLINLTLEPMSIWFKRKWLEWKLEDEYMNMSYFKDMAKEAHRGQSDASKRIVNLEMQLRDLR